MPPPADAYHDASYAERPELTAGIRCMLDAVAKEDDRKLKILFGAIFLAGLALFLVRSPMTAALVVAGFLGVILLSVLVIVRINRKGDQVVADCPGCSQPMHREQRGGQEFHVCHECRIYALGRDWS